MGQWLIACRSQGCMLSGVTKYPLFITDLPATWGAGASSSPIVCPISWSIAFLYQLGLVEPVKFTLISVYAAMRVLPRLPVPRAVPTPPEEKGLIWKGASSSSLSSSKRIPQQLELG